MGHPCQAPPPHPPLPPPHNDLHGRMPARLQAQRANVLLLVPIHGQEAESLLGGVRHEPTLASAPVLLFELKKPAEEPSCLSSVSSLRSASAAIPVAPVSGNVLG